MTKVYVNCEIVVVLTIVLFVEKIDCLIVIGWDMQFENHKICGVQVAHNANSDFAFDWY